MTGFAIILIVYKIKSYDLDYSAFMEPKMAAMLGLMLVAYTLNIISSTFPWKKMVEIVSGKELPYITTVFVAVRSNLLKYLPGNVFQYIGKNELAVKCSIGHAQVAFATLADIMVMLTTAFALGSIFVKDYLFEIVKNYLSLQNIIIIIIVGLICACIAAICLTKRNIDIFERIVKILKHPGNIKKFFLCVIYYIIQNIWVGGIYIIILGTVSGNNNEQIPISLILGANIISGVIGLLTPGAPGGLGIREVVMLIITKGIFSEPDIMLTSVVYRVLTIIGDGLAFLVVFFAIKLCNKNIFGSELKL